MLSPTVAHEPAVPLQRMTVVKPIDLLRVTLNHGGQSYFTSQPQTVKLKSGAATNKKSFERQFKKLGENYM